MNNAPSWVRYPKEKLYTAPPLRMFACVKKANWYDEKNMLSFLCVYFCDEFKKQLLSHIIYLFFVSAIFRMRNKNISIIVVTKSFLFFSTWYEEKLEQISRIFLICFYTEILTWTDDLFDNNLDYSGQKFNVENGYLNYDGSIWLYLHE